MAEPWWHNSANHYEPENYLFSNEALQFYLFSNEALQFYLFSNEALQFYLFSNEALQFYLFSNEALQFYLWLSENNILFSASAFRLSYILFKRKRFN